MAHRFRGFSNGWLALKQKPHGRRACWKKAVQLMATRKQKERGKNQRGRDTLQRHIPRDTLLHTRAHLPTVRSAMNSPMDEYSTPMIQSPFKSPISGHLRLWRDSLDVNHNRNESLKFCK